MSNVALAAMSCSFMDHEVSEMTLHRSTTLGMTPRMHTANERDATQAHFPDSSVGTLLHQPPLPGWGVWFQPAGSWTWLIPQLAQKKAKNLARILR